MKTQLRFALACLSACLGTAPLSAAPLTWKFKEGEVLRYVRTQERVMKNAVGGQISDQRVVRETTMTLRCQKAEADGAAFLSLTIDRVKVEQTSPKGVVKYDTQSTEDAVGEARRLAESLKPMIGFTFLFRANARGQVSDVSFSPESRKLLGENANWAKSFANADALRQLSPLFLLPADDANTWVEEMEFTEPLVGTRKLRVTYTLAGTVNRGGQELEQLKLVTKATLVQPPEAKIGVNLRDFQGDGLLEFDARSGRLVHRVDSDRSKTTFTLGSNTVDSEATNKITLKLLP